MISMKPVPSVICFTTGGTIASVDDPDSSGPAPTMRGEALVEAIPDLAKLAQVDVCELAAVSSAAVVPTQAFSWARMVARALEGPQYAGAVVTFGTDTLEEAAYLFDLALRTRKPIVFTGAMRVASDLVVDGYRNLKSAIQVAASTAAHDIGVLVVMNDEIHAARDVTKAHSEGIHAFESPNAGPLGIISRAWDGDSILLYRRPLLREHVPTQQIEPRVAYVKALMGSDASVVDGARSAGARGLVVEAFAGGEVPPAMGEAMERAAKAGVSVVLATSARRGRPLDVWPGVGEGRWLRERGIYFADTLNAPKARVKLMLALGLNDATRLADFFP